MIVVGTNTGNVAEAAMSLINLPELVEGRPTSATVVVVGLLGRLARVRWPMPAARCRWS